MGKSFFKREKDLFISSLQNEKEGLRLTQPALLPAGGWSDPVLTWHLLGHNGSLVTFAAQSLPPRVPWAPGCRDPEALPQTMVIPKARMLQLPSESQLLLGLQRPAASQEL